MENKIYNDDVERIVNDPERQMHIMAERIEKRNRKISLLRDRAIICFVFSIVIVALGFFELIVMWFSLSVGVVFLVVSSFFFGRWIENWKTQTFRRRGR